MPKVLVQLAMVVLAGIWLAASIPAKSFAQQTQGQQSADQQKKKPSGSAKPTAKTPPAPAHDADKLTPERMSTRGLHKGGGDQGSKQDEPSKAKQDQSTSKSDPQK